MKRVLLLDTNVSSFPIFEILESRGYETYVIGTNDNDCLAKKTKKYINLNYSNIDDLKKIIDEFSFDYIVPGCNDVSYISASKVNNNFFGLDRPDVSEILNNKYKFRKFAIENNLSVPLIFSKEEIINKDIPVIIKPVDAYSGRGVSVVNNKENIDLSINEALNFSKTKKYVIEEYVVGQLYSHSAFISNKKIFVDFIVIENGTTNEFTVDTSRVVFDFPNEILSNIRKEIELLSEKLNLVDGLIHTQFIKTNNFFKIIEITRRCPGDLYSLLIEKTTGFKYAEVYLKPFINESIFDNNLELQKNKIIRHTISTENDTNFLGIKFKKPINVDFYVSLSKTGDLIKKSPFGRVGLIFIKCESQNELLDTYNMIVKKELYSL